MICIILDLILGASFPVSGIIFARIISKMYNPMARDFESKINFLILLNLLIGLIFLTFYPFIKFFDSIVSNNLTYKLRKICFDKIIHMPADWLDREENNPGALAARLEVDCQLVNQLTSIYNFIFQIISSLITGIVLSFIYSWQLALIIFGFIPFVVVSAILFKRIFEKKKNFSDAQEKKANQMITEVASNIKIIASFGNNEFLYKLFCDLFQDSPRVIKSLAFQSGFYVMIFEFIKIINKNRYRLRKQSCFQQWQEHFILELVWYYIKTQTQTICYNVFFCFQFKINIIQQYTAQFALMFAAFAIARMQFFMPDIGKAYQSAQNLFNTIDLEDEKQKNLKEIEMEVVVGESKRKINGEIQFQNVSFAYQRDKKQRVLTNFNLTVRPAEKLAIVGISGIGKSTIFSLLLRLYGVDQGTILLDGKDIRKYDIYELRRAFGVVLQQPVLLNGTIHFNIKYNQQDVTQEDIERAIQNAQAFDFIFQDQSNDGKGLQRMVGHKGSQLSGGQKQRIAIARALVRKEPQIYLFDEITSSLDSQTELKLMKQLKETLKDKTCIIISQRISTIRECDRIILIENGQIVEEGTYQQLMDKKGKFYCFSQGIKE